MNYSRIIAELKAVYQTEKPLRKEAFLTYIREQGRLCLRPAAMTQGEFLLRQLAYTQKRVWILSALVLLVITWLCRQSSGVYPFAMTSLLSAGILAETGRSFHHGMHELEYASRFSFRSVMLARLFLVGTADTLGLFLVIAVICPGLPYSLTRIFLYMMVPYLSASFLGSLYERRHRTDSGWGSVMICAALSAAFAAAPAVCRGLYDGRYTVYWLLLFAVLLCSAAASMRKWIIQTEEPAWS